MAHPLGLFFGLFFFFFDDEQKPQQQSWTIDTVAPSSTTPLQSPELQCKVLRTKFANSYIMSFQFHAVLPLAIVKKQVDCIEGVSYVEFLITGKRPDLDDRIHSTQVRIGGKNIRNHIRNPASAACSTKRPKIKSNKKAIANDVVNVRRRAK
jgi:hypothetical protein